MIRTAIIGYGGMGAHHAQLIKNKKDFCVAGVYDIDPARQETGRKDGYKVYSSKEEVALDEGVDAVLIATPNDFHLPYCEFFAEAKKHIICEKPASDSVKNFDKMVLSAKNAGVVLAIHQNRRQDKDYLAVLEIIRSGVIGQVYRLDSFVVGANGIPGGWRKIKKQGGGMMLDWGVHLIDQIMLTPGFENPGSVFCKYSYIQGHEVEDGFSLTFFYETAGTEVNIEVLTGCYVKKPRWIVYGTLGTAEITGFNSEGNIIVRTDSNEEIIPAKLGNGYSRTMAVAPDSHRTELKIPDVKPDENFFYSQFYDAVFKNKPHSVKNSEVRKVITIMEKCEKAAKKSKIIKI